MCNLAIPAVIGAGLQIANAVTAAGDDGAAAREEAEELRARGAREAALARRDSERARSQSRVGLLRGGVTDAGSPTDVLVAAAQEDSRDAQWAERGYSDAARAKERDARRARRRGVLDQLSSANALGSNLITLDQTGGLYKW